MTTCDVIEIVTSDIETWYFCAET